MESFGLVNGRHIHEICFTKTIMKIRKNMKTSLSRPDLGKTINVTHQQSESFRRDGHVLIPGVLDADETAYYREVINNATMANNTETRKMEDRDTYGKAFLQVMNLWKADAAVADFSLARRFGKIAADLLGVDSVRIYHDQALYKEPGGGPTPWHQDQFYWPLDTRNTVTMWMPLVDITEEMGMLTFASGSHTAGFAGDVAISDESEALFQNMVNDKGLDVTRAKTMKAGDATWHYGWTLHMAPGNHTTDKMREVMTIIFFADGARITAPKNDYQKADLAAWLGNSPVGSVATSELNPVVYSA